MTSTATVPAEITTRDLTTARHGNLVLQLGDVNGAHAVVIQARHARLQLYPRTNQKSVSTFVMAADAESNPVRRGGRIPILAAIISALGVVAAALVAGAFTIWRG